MADAVAGGDTRKLGKMMEAGELIPEEVLPKFFALMEERAQQGWGTYQQSVAYQQGQSEYQFSNLIKSFTFAGGDQGFVNMWKMVQQSLKEMIPLAGKLGEKFYDISKNFENVTNMIRLASKLMQKEGDIFSPWMKSLMEFSALLFSKFYRIWYVIDKIAIIIEDLMAYKAGEASHIGNILNSGGSMFDVVVDGLMSMGWAAPIAALALAGLVKSILTMTGVAWALDKLFKSKAGGVLASGASSGKGSGLLKGAAVISGALAVQEGVNYLGREYIPNYESSGLQNLIGKPIWQNPAVTGAWNLTGKAVDFMKSAAGFDGMSPQLQESSNKYSGGLHSGVMQSITGDININIDGSNLNKEEVAKTIKDTLNDEWRNQLQLTPTAW